MEYPLNEKITNEQMNKLILESQWRMNSLKITIPYSYLSNHISLNWYDILFAIENGFLPHQSANDYAVNDLLQDGNSSQSVLELVYLSPNKLRFPHSIHPYIDELADQVSELEKGKTKEKMLYILLQYLYDNRDKYEDPLTAVTIIYDDFGFPDSITSFVLYMPMKGPDLGSIELNRERMMTSWKNFLGEQSEKYKNLEL